MKRTLICGIFFYLILAVAIYFLSVYEKINFSSDLGQALLLFLGIVGPWLAYILAPFLLSIKNKIKVRVPKKISDYDITTPDIP